MLRKKFCDILHKVQQSSSCHQKYRHILIKLYNENSFDDFESEFMRCVERIFGIEIKHKNIHVERCMEFLATFVTTLVKNQENTSVDDEEELEIHPFLNAVINNVIQYHRLEQVSARFRSCQFINLILRHLGDDAHIDSDIANAIQVTMTERLDDPKTSVRLQAVKALVRLQIPEDVTCPVMNSLMGKLYESSAQVRRQIVESIAVVPTFIPRIIERVRDSDSGVRLAAYKKCFLIGPKLITIANRRLIINSGFTEEHDLVKKMFLEEVLPKWLTVYNGDYVLLLKGLKFDAYEEDLQETESISKRVLQVFFNSQPMDTFLEFLPLENNVVPVQKLSTELALFWSIFVDFLRKSDDKEEYLVQVIPEMTHFCTYMEKIYEESKKKVDWRFLEFQQIFCQLLKIAKEFDYSDELGRKTMQKLLHHLLLDGKFTLFVFTEIICILVKINPVFDSLTIDICHLISDIHEPLVEKPPSRGVLIENNFKLAELRVKINILNDERDTAVAESDYEKAAKIKRQLSELNQEVEKLSLTPEQPTQIRTAQDDSETLCRCLNILIAVLSNPKLKTLTASLRSCKDEFVTPLLNHSDVDVFAKAFKSIALCCLLDEQMIREHLKLICSPIVAYRLMPHYDKATLLVSIGAFSDALRIFGTDIFSNTSNGDITEGQNFARRRLNGTRRLYTTSHTDNTDNVDFEDLSCEEILFVLVDMLDDENQELREYAGRGLCELVKASIIVSPTIISRLILKWFNPATERCDQKLQQLLAHAIVSFAQDVKNSEEILEKAIIPILTSLGNAPSTSPLSDVNADNAIEFLSAITFIQKSTSSHNVHKNLAFALCHKISSRPEDRCVPLYVKMLLTLELALEEDAMVFNELINQAQLITEEIIDKNMKKNLQKFSGRLIDLRNRLQNKDRPSNRPRNSLAEPLPDTPGRHESRVLHTRMPLVDTVARENVQTISETYETDVNNTETDQNTIRSSIANGNKSRGSVANRRSTENNLNTTQGSVRNNSMQRNTVNDHCKTQGFVVNNSMQRSTETSFANKSVRRSAEKGDNKTRWSVVNDSRQHVDENTNDETILHTIIENCEPEMGSFHDDSIQSNNDSREVRKSGRLRLKTRKGDEKKTFQNSEHKKTERNLRITTNQAPKRRKMRGRPIKDNEPEQSKSFTNDNMTIESPTSSSSHNSSVDSTESRRRSRRIVMSATSSDSEESRDRLVRKSLKKKRKT